MNETSRHNKKVIVWLILQDLKHRRITCGRCLQPVNELHELSILNIVVKLMGINQDKDKARTSEQLVELYYELLNKSGDELQPLAENIYDLMSGCVQLDQRRFYFQNLLPWKRNRKKRSGK